ncbi:hypothetical protein HBI24_078610 [Parastagonospora nodorum]|nr:hypothetical protein HBI24_078610 [Parastagonospora nodorum]
MTGGAGPSGTVDESGNKPVATEQVKQGAERRRENLRQEQIRAEGIMNRDLRPYYPPNHEDDVLTDDEMRRRAEVAAYMANEQKVKHRLKRIRFVRDRAKDEGLLFSPTLLSSFTGTPEERV